MQSAHSQSQGILHACTLVGGSSVCPDPELHSLPAVLGNMGVRVSCGPALSSTSQFQYLKDFHCTQIRILA